MIRKTYKDFADALYELKKIHDDISYGRISQKTGILEATVNALANRRRANPPKADVIKKIADLFNVRPEYFYEHRLRKVLDYINNNRKFLDVIERAMRKYKAEKVVEDDEPEEELGLTGEKKS